MGSTESGLPRISEETQLNINQSVKVALTPRGLEVLREKLSGNPYQDPSGVDQLIEHYRRGDFFVFQMYEFMAIFGPALPTFPTMDPHYRLFERNDIILMPGF